MQKNYYLNWHCLFFRSDMLGFITVTYDYKLNVFIILMSEVIEQFLKLN